VIAFAWAEFSLGLLAAFTIFGVLGVVFAIWLLAHEADHELNPPVAPDKVEPLEDDECVCCPHITHCDALECEACSGCLAAIAGEEGR
jgi:hypothetical protein